MSGKAAMNVEEKRRRRMMRKKKKESKEFVYILFRQYLCRVNLTKLYRRPERPPAFETLIFFPEKNYPVGMGANCFESGLYLIGGEKLQQGKQIEFSNPFARPEALDSLCSTLFLFNPSSSSIPIPPMIAPKTGAKSVIFDGKLFVLCGVRYCLRKDEPPPSPRFECYDPAVNRWDPLPEPPFYWDLLAISLIVIGRRIFASHNSGRGLHYYDVDEMKWTLGKEYLRLVPDPFEFYGDCMAEFKDGIIIGYTELGLVAYKDNSLTNPQRILTKLNSDKYLSTPRPAYQAVYIRHLGDGRFCIVMIGLIGRIHIWDAHVALFQVKKLQQQNHHPGEDLVDAVLLRHHLYDGLSTSVRWDFHAPIEVFTMKEGMGRSGGGHVSINI